LQATADVQRFTHGIAAGDGFRQCLQSLDDGRIFFWIFGLSSG
jgi:hypothetical protein